MSIEVLSKGTYKAAIESGPIMAVKRLKETSLLEREFRDKVAAIGGIDLPNVRKNERLMMYEFMAMDSLSSMLYGMRSVFLSSNPLCFRCSN